MDNIVLDARQNMQRAFEVLLSDFATVRTGRATPSLVENIIIAAYGGTQKLKVMELATISVTDPQTLVVTPFDQSIIEEIRSGIEDHGLGIAPVIDGNIIRISLPPLTQERRQEFIKLIKQKAEAGRVMIRQVRHEGMEEVKKQAERISEDEVERTEKEIQKATDEFTQRIEKLLEEKEKELLTI